MPSTKPKSRTSIVVADDHADSRAFMKAALERAGYEVRMAEHGGRALALLRERSAALLITDIFMPDVEGFETVTRCRAEFAGTKIIVVSSGTIPGTKHDFLSTASLLGVSATLRKPFTADQLLEVVRRVRPPE